MYSTSQMKAYVMLQAPAWGLRVRMLRVIERSPATTDGVGVDVITVRAWMLCVNGWSRGGRYYGSGMDAISIISRTTAYKKPPSNKASMPEP